MYLKSLNAVSKNFLGTFSKNPVASSYKRVNYVLFNHPVCKSCNAHQFFSSYNDKDNQNSGLAIPKFSNLPEIVWPSLFKSIKNVIYTYFIIKPYFDVEFDLNDFEQGSRKVSSFSFPYQIGIMFSDEEASKETQQQRFVEITMCYHAIYGLHKLRAAKNFDENFQQSFQNKQMENKVFIINFRFIKEFTKGVSSSWTINALNYFKPRTA
ncbi:uncharacterized protein LOC103523273 [Diaphorina citri]|uniref:Uncharacterized protein LOC103523273 n=1 Tax=Diaphorina citri TaxID=121845 RepID=A0A3Q0JK38_DIACI|nr:uncharacterized protein LOC103523273 [Diaphorina citri]